MHLRSDEIREHIFSKPDYSAAENRKLFGLIDFLVEKLLSSGVSVYYDANFTRKDIRLGQQKNRQKIQSSLRRGVDTDTNRFSYKAS